MKRVSIGLLTGLFFSAWVSAGITESIKSLNDQGKFAEAYKLAQNQLDSFEGDPKFDLQYGVAAIDSGHISEGIFALERVVFLEPNNALAKLELARAYFLLKQFDKSRTLFNQVKAANPPPVVMARINQFLEQITNKTTIPPTKFSGFAELWAGYDDNINSGPGGQTQVVTLSDSALGRGDQFNQIRLNGSVEHAYSPQESLLFSANADFRYYHTEPEQNYKSFTVNGSHLWKRDSEQYQLGFTTQNYQIDRENYRTLIGMNGVWSKQLTPNSVLKSFAGVNSLNYASLTWKDATQINLGTNYLYAGSGKWQPLYFVGGFLGDESPKVDGVLAAGQVDRLFFGANAGVQLTPYQDVTFTPSVTYQGSRFEGNDWIYNIKRKDDFYMLNLNLEWVMHPSWSLLANYSFTDVNSNIEIYEYDRQQIMFGLRYNFQ